LGERQAEGAISFISPLKWAIFDSQKISVHFWQISIRTLPLPSSGENMKPGQNIREYG